MCTIRRLVVAAALTLVALPVGAQEATRELDGLTGPAAPRGLSVEDLGALHLGREFADSPLVATRALRARILRLAPGGVVPIHSHADRPAITYLLAGEVVEHRSDRDEPRVHTEGAVTLDGDGVAQWWENVGDKEVVFYVVDFVDTGSEPDH